MTSKKKLNAENLKALGAQRLADLLMDIANGDAATKRRLRLELIAQEAPETVGAEVRKRLTQIARARSFADWRKVRDLAVLANQSPETALAAVLRFQPGSVSCVRLKGTEFLDCGAQAKIQIACYANTSPKALISRRSPRPT